jgi:hypothetical protein
MQKRVYVPTLSILLTILAAALGLAWISSSFTNVEGFFPFVLVLILAVLALWAGWKLIQSETPGTWLLYLVIGAVVLRLIFGAAWLIGLPIYGHPNDTQQSGYIMYDAYRRDTAAWELSQSEQPLLSSFQGASHMDQYGGLLFLSGFVYRYLANDAHYPLQMVVITAAFSAVAVWYAWGISKQLWGEKTAKTAAWLLALYPEAVLLGSSQMREAFTITLLTGFSYYLITYWKQREQKSLYGMAAAVIISGLISWPIVVMELFVAAVLSITLYPWKTSGRKRMQMLFASIWILITILVIVAFNTLDWWELVIDYQSYTTVAGSGKLDAVLGRLPEWLHVPYLVVYGIVRPLLPSALVAYNSGWMWHAIAIWRALGWTILFGLFLYTNLLAFKEKTLRNSVGALLMIVWVGIIFASVRGGGDLWDNPRYRVTVSGLQACLVAWGLWQQKESKDPWLRRVIVAVGMLIAWFLAWYIDRKVIGYGWPVSNMLHLVLLALASGAVYIAWDWWRLSKRNT